MQQIQTTQQKTLNELDETLSTLVNRARKHQLSEERLLAIAADIAACHPGLKGQEQMLRSFLAVAAGWKGLAEELAGEPRRVVDFSAAADRDLKQARIAGEARAVILEEEMLSSSEAASRLGARPSNREKINSYRRRSLLLGLPRNGGRLYLYPAFQIDSEHQDIFAEVRKVNQLLEASEDPWGAASWWVSPNGLLDAIPKDCLGTPRAQDVVHAVQALLEPLG